MKRISPSKIFGIYVIIVGLIILFKILFPVDFKIIYIISILLIIPAVDFIIRGGLRKKRRLLLIPGITIFLFCVFLIIYFLFFAESYFTIKKIWPILGVFPAAGLVVYYFISFKKSPAIIVPGVFLIFLSIILLLFTTNIINFKFIYFLLLLIPSMLILTGLYLVFRNEFIGIKKNKDKNI